MCENESVTQSFSRNSEEDTWLLKGVSIHAERNFVMKNKFKMGIFSVVMSITMLITSMVVFAAIKSNSEEVAIGGGAIGTASIWIERGTALSAGASTYGESSLSTVAYTSIYGGGPTPHSNQGRYETEVFASANAFTYAQSEHAWSGKHWAMIIYP